MTLRGVAKNLIKKAGYDIHPFSRLCFVQKDAFADQEMLLSNGTLETIFDIGANSGQTAAKYKALFPASTIYSFEPFTDPFTELRSNFVDDPLVKPIQLAVSNQSGHQHFHLNQSSFTNSLLPSVEHGGLYETLTTIEVPVITIDEFCQQEAIDEIQILKMDIQGGELMALEGAATMLRQKSIHLIYSEILFASFYEGQAMFFQLYDYLWRYDYALFDMYNLIYENGRLAWGDAIFISPQLAAISPLVNS